MKKFRAPDEISTRNRPSSISDAFPLSKLSINTMTAASKQKNFNSKIKVEKGNLTYSRVGKRLFFLKQSVIHFFVTIFPLPKRREILSATASIFV